VPALRLASPQRAAGARFHNNRKRLFSNAPADTASHFAEPFVYRLLAPFWTQIWLRARAG